MRMSDLYPVGFHLLGAALKAKEPHETLQVAINANGDIFAAQLSYFSSTRIPTSKGGFAGNLISRSTLLLDISQIQPGQEIKFNEANMEYIPGLSISQDGLDRIAILYESLREIPGYNINDIVLPDIQKELINGAILYGLENHYASGIIKGTDANSIVAYVLRGKGEGNIVRLNEGKLDFPSFGSLPAWKNDLPSLTVRKPDDNFKPYTEDKLKLLI